jgi:hypothetical protein
MSPLRSNLGFSFGYGRNPISSGGPFWIGSFYRPSGSTSGVGDIVIDSFGNSYFVSNDNYVGNQNNILIKCNSLGQIQWQRNLSYSTSLGEPCGISVDSSGNVYVGTYIASSAMVVIKYNSSGILQWQRTLGGVTLSALSMKGDSSGNVYITADNVGLSATYIAKYNSSGTLQWQQSIGAVNFSGSSRSAAIDSSGNLYLCGFANFASPSRQVFFAKFNSSGALQWQKIFGGSGVNMGFGITVDNSGNVYITGNTNSSGAGSYDLFIAKYNSTPTLQWQRTLGGINVDGGAGVVTDNSGNVYVCGTTASTGAGSGDALIVKYNSSGALQWQRTLGSTGNESAAKIVTDGVSSLYITGSNQNSSAILTAKLPINGSLTGNYSSYIYSVSALTDSVSSFTDAAGSGSVVSTSLTDAAGGLTDSAGNFNSSITYIDR